MGSRTGSGVPIFEGEKHGRLTVIKEVHSIGNGRRVLVKCECDKEKEMGLYKWRGGDIKSCGCLVTETMIKRKLTHGEARSITGEYWAWQSMTTRCTNKNAHNYHLYGGRGITVCDRWIKSYETFLSDMGRKPTKEHSLDRIDVNGNYEQSNCRWATKKEQANNRRTSRKIEHLGESKNVEEWAKIYNVNTKTLYGQLWRNEFNLDIVNFKYYHKFLYLKEAV
jgi:hypothetical protein